jgi:hypothetical protein
MNLEMNLPVIMSGLLTWLIILRQRQMAIAISTAPLRDQVIRHRQLDGGQPF